VIKPPGKLSYCHMSNISTSGDVAVAITYRKGASEYGELTLFNSDGEIAWSKRYDNEISNPQLSDDGNTIVVKQGINTLTAYNKRGKLLWTYSVEEGQRIRDYKLSRDGRYTVIVVPDFFSLKGHFILLREGEVEWVKSRDVAIEIAISPNNAYIVSASYDKRNIHVTLYTIDGVELWNTEVGELPRHVDVSDNGEVLLVTYHLHDFFKKLYFITHGRVLWAKDYCQYAVFTRSGDKIIAVRRHGNRGALEVIVLNREGEFLWKYQGKFRFAVSDNYFALADSSEIVFVSAESEVLQRIKLSELLNRESADVNISISPDGRYFAVGVEDKKDGKCHLYFYENRDHLIRGIKERLLKEIDELIKR